MSVPSDRVDAEPGAAARVEELHAAHAGTVRAICRGMLRDRHEAEDAEQQTFLSAHRALANGSRPEDPAAWLATIAKNECLARVRARMRDPLPVEEPETRTAPDAHAAALRRHDVAELRGALAGLPAQQRDAILLRELRGLSYEEVAASLAVTTSAVESLLFRARRRLQSQLRGALAGVMPGNVLAGLRELVLRLGGTGVAAPVAAKVVAVGVGTAVVAGGAVIAAPQFAPHGSAGTHRASHRHPAASAAAPVAPVGTWTPPAATPPAPVRRVTVAKHESSDGGDGVQREDGQASGTYVSSERESGDSGSSSSSETDRHDGGTQTTPSSSGQSQDQSGDGGGSTAWQGTSGSTSGDGQWSGSGSDGGSGSGSDSGTGD